MSSKNRECFVVEDDFGPVEHTDEGHVLAFTNDFQAAVNSEKQSEKITRYVPAIEWRRWDPLDPPDNGDYLVHFGGEYWEVMRFTGGFWFCSSGKSYVHPFGKVVYTPVPRPKEDTNE